MKFIGKYGEHLVLSKLLRIDTEAYLAIKSNQEDYDITVITDSGVVKRIQVKSTELHNKNTNNSISGIEKAYDYLVLVIIDKNEDHIFILTHKEAQNEKGDSSKFSCSYKEKGVSKIKDDLEKYREQWQKITSA